MNYKNMTFAEIFRIAEPQTELEKVLIERFEEELEIANEEIAQQLAEVRLNEHEDKIYELQGHCMVLEAILDEHKIEHPK